MADMGFQGFDGSNNYHMTEKEQKKENWSQSKIFIVIGVFMALCLALSVSMQVREIVLMSNGTMVEAPYNSETKTATIDNEDGTKTYISLSGSQFADTKGDSVKLYYKDNIKDAKPMTQLWFFLAMYVLWGGLLAVCIRHAYRSIKGR